MRKNKEPDFPYIPFEERIQFPDALTVPGSRPALAGANLSPGVLLSAYEQGFFPWYSEPPILWWSPDPRFGFDPQTLEPNKTGRKILRKHEFVITMNRAFKEVIYHASLPRKNHDGTWITQEMMDAYIELHKRGRAHSVEAWSGESLVGGLYGVDLGRIFCGESMFTLVPNASKVCFYYLINHLKERNYIHLDSQVSNDYTESLGGFEISRKDYIELIREHVS